MSTVATRKTKKKDGVTLDDESSPKPALLSSASFDAARHLCEHEWMSHNASETTEVGAGVGVGGERDVDGDVSVAKKKNRFDEETTTMTIAPPKPPAVVAAAPCSTLTPTAMNSSAPQGANGAVDGAPRASRQQQFAASESSAGDRRASSPLPVSPLPSTPSTSDNDDEDLDLVPERGTFRSRRDTAASRLPMTSPAVSDGGGLRDEHVEDPWSDDESENDGNGGNDDSESGVSGRGSDGDNERSGNGGGGTTPLATSSRSKKRRSRKLCGGGSSSVRRALLPFPGGANRDGDNGDKKKKQRKKKPQKKHLERSRSLRSPGRHFTVVTTASLPWMTGTSVNPTLRSAYLARALPRSSVTLMLPWLPASQQPCVFPKGMSFETPEQQEEHVREWIRQRTGFEPPGLRITWYHARYCPVMKSIFPYGGKERGSGFFFPLFCPRKRSDIATAKKFRLFCSLRAKLSERASASESDGEQVLSTLSILS